MFKDEGVRNHNQIQGLDKDGNIKNVRVNKNGALITTQEIPSEVGGVFLDKIHKCDIATIDINKKSIFHQNIEDPWSWTIKKINIANCSDTAILTVSITGAEAINEYRIAPNFIVELVLNEKIEEIELSLSEGTANIQYLIEGKEGED